MRLAVFLSLIMFFSIQSNVFADSDADPRFEYKCENDNCDIVNPDGGGGVGNDCPGGDCGIDNDGDEKINWAGSYDDAKKKSEDSDKPVFVVISKPGSDSDSKKLFSETLKNSDVRKKLGEFVSLHANLEASKGRGIAGKLGFSGDVPAVMIYSKGFVKRISLKEGFVSADDLIKLLEDGKKKASGKSADTECIYQSGPMDQFGDFRGLGDSLKD